MLQKSNSDKPNLQRRFGRKARLALCVALALVAAPIVIWATSKSTTQAIGSPEPPSVPVTAVTAARRNVPLFLTGLGTVQAFNTVTVKPRVGGQIIDLPFVEGQELQQGAVVAHIDPRPYAAALRQAEGVTAKDEAQLANAELDLARSTNLAQKGYATTQALDTQKAQVAAFKAAIESDKAAVESSQTQLDYATVKSPIVGVPGLRMVDAGNVVAPSDPGIVVITQIEPITVVFTLPEDAIRALPVGRPTGTFAVDALARDNTTVLAHGTLSLVDNRIDPTTGMARLKATFPNTDRALKPGQFVNARLKLETLPDAVTLPAMAVQMDQQGQYVYVIRRDGSVDQRRIDVARNTGGFAVVTGGLQADENVVLDGQYGLKPGTKVAIQANAQSVDSRGAAALPGLP
ncbi:MAG TPA: efflux RND transporter periplasmic adaptor subunit [Pseudolabrys sp.]